MTGIDWPLGSVTNLLSTWVNEEKKIMEETIWAVALVSSIQYVKSKTSLFMVEKKRGINTR